MQRRDLLKSLTGVAAVSLTGPISEAGQAPTSPAAEPLTEKDVSYWTETSLVRVFPNSPPGAKRTLRLQTARNAKLSFQLCFRNHREGSIRVRANVEAPQGWEVTVRRVGYVPVAQITTDVPYDEIEGIEHLPGMAPDPLYPEATAHVGPDANGAFWISLKAPADAAVGAQPIKATLTVEDEFRFPGWTGAPPTSVELPVMVEVDELVLEPRRDFPATQWISIDSIWEYYKIEPFSDRFWELADAYVADMVSHNFDVIYSPIFNARHELLERPAQLLRVRATEGGGYELDFTDVRRWIRIAKKHGARYLEWTHFFTPAPTSGRHPQRIYHRWDGFGELLWPPDTLATSAEYRRFLEQLLPEFKRVLEEEGAFEMSLFHCADEPDGDVQLADYRAARSLLRELAPWMQVIDAMSDPRYATEKLTDMPVPSIATAPQFTAAGCPAWVYFCCGPRGRYLQRLLDTPLAKIRMAGWLFYKLQARGFLHWGHNYWFVFCTGTPLNPFNDASTGAWPGMPYGDAFVVYPGTDGPIDSIRWEVLAESMQDYALLQTAGVSPDSPLLAQLKSYEDFPKSKEWIESAIAEVLATS